MIDSGDGGWNFSGFASMAVANGKPAVLYYSSEKGELRYAVYMPE